MGANALLIKAVDNAAPAQIPIVVAVLVIRPDLNDSPNSIFVPTMLLNAVIPTFKAANNPRADDVFAVLHSTILCIMCLGLHSDTDSIIGVIIPIGITHIGTDNNPPSVALNIAAPVSPKGTCLSNLIE
nr:hypothetical protein M8J77_022002 [Diaphorina citri]